MKVHTSENFAFFRQRNNFLFGIFHSDSEALDEIFPFFWRLKRFRTRSPKSAAWGKKKVYSEIKDERRKKK